MKRLLLSLVSVSLGMLVSTAAQAETLSSANSTSTPAAPSAVMPPATPVFVPYGGWDEFGPYSHSSSLQEGYLNGLASVIQARAMYGVAASQAAANLSLARLRNIEAATAFYQLRKANREYQVSLRPPKWTEEELARLARSRLPPRPSAAELNPDTGRITWPTLLSGPKFAPLRAQVERGFAERAAKGYLGPASYSRLHDSLQQLRELLAQHIRDYPEALFVPADHFLRSLTYEATLPGGSLATQITTASSPRQ